MKKFLSFITLLTATNIYLGCLSVPGHHASLVILSHDDEALQTVSTAPTIILPI